MQNQHPLFAAQLQLEDEMRSMGVTRYRELVAQAKADKEESRVTSVRRLMGQAHEAVVAGIEDFIAAASSGKAGRKHSALRFVLALDDVDLVAHLTIRSVLDSVSSQETLNRAALGLATLLEDEYHFRQFEEQKPTEFAQRKRAVERGGKNARRVRKSMLIPARKMGVELDDWSLRDKLLVGTKLIEIFVEQTGYAEIERTSDGKNNTPVYLRATEATLKWLEQENARLEWMQPVYLPTIIPPKPWTSPTDGGYWSGRVRRLRLVKTNNRQYLDELADRDMPTVYASINALQETPWAINKRVLEVMETLWEQQADVSFLPRADQEELPPRPLWLSAKMTKEEMTEEQREAFGRWKQERSLVYERNAKSVSKRLSFTRMLMVARKFRDHEEIFFPHQLDWRGRMYPVTLYLQPQGNDAQRGLLEFARAVPLTDDDGVLWLAVHGAGLWGKDKWALEERRAWVEENEEAILASAADPLANRFWMTAEKPWQALAFCFDWAGWKREGYAYESCLPVQMDGTCNGLQNFSALLRDEVGGRAVNLVPSDSPNDIYATVAEVVSRKVEADLTSDEVVKDSKGNDRYRVADMAAGWLGKVDRKVTKRPVMTLAYGARRFGFIQQVFEDTVSPWKAKADGTFPWQGSGWAAADYMGRLIWESVGEVVVAATRAMDWLQGAARVAAQEGLPVLWTTPTGFLVHQAYRVPQQKRIELTFQRVNLKLSVEMGEGKIDSRRQASGVSPNWIHSLDASHMQRTIHACHDLGLRSFSMIHDSYGTHAGNAQLMANVLREEFVRQYEGNVLEKFRDDLLAQLPEGSELDALPPMGNLDLNKVLESPFFFA